jgi:hypothetical protein
VLEDLAPKDVVLQCDGAQPAKDLVTAAAAVVTVAATGRAPVRLAADEARHELGRQAVASHEIILETDGELGSLLVSRGLSRG